MKCRCVLVFLFVSVWGAAPARAQQATVSGFVTDRTDGQPLELVNVVLRQRDAIIRGVATDRDGSYLMPRLAPGRYALSASFIGYHTFQDTLDLAAGQVLPLNIALAPDEGSLDEVVVETERTTGAARITAGQQTVRARDVELVPTPDVSGDLAAYLTTLPGVVSTGDRGGQLFIRGGEPSQNLVQLDGMLIYQPFHILGFYSAFPADIISRSDIYAGGYGSKFGNRISSVIDVWTRNGNNRRFGGAASLSPFIATARLEGPVVPNRLSLLVSARRSMIEAGAQHLLEEPLPFHFDDTFVKLHGLLDYRSRLSLQALRTHDRGALSREAGEADELRWRNEAVGLRYLLLPRIFPVVADLHVSYSRLSSALGPPDEPLRTSSVNNTLVGLDANFAGDRTDVEAGISLRFTTLNSQLGGLFQGIETRKTGLDHAAFYVDPDVKLGRGWRVRPGMRLQFFRARIDPYPEPRLRIVWAQGAHQVSGAAGLYHQEVVGLSDRRDAASIFTAWTAIPRAEPDSDDVRAGRIQRAWHYILGYQGRPAAWLEYTVEGYYKDLANLFVSEWTAFPRFTTRLQPAHGRSYGFDVRMEVRRAPFYGYVNYGYASTLYAAEQAALALWYGEETLRFRPPHDRRHQVNALVSVNHAGFELSARWAFGSGLPFSRALGFDGFAVIDDVVDITQVPRSRRVIYERPFNGVLPTYHRLDVALERTFMLGAASLTLQGSLINAYDRRNLFYLDVFTLERADQLPLVPSLGLKVAFE